LRPRVGESRTKRKGNTNPSAVEIRVEDSRKGFVYRTKVWGGATPPRGTMINGVETNRKEKKKGNTSDHKNKQREKKVKKRVYFREMKKKRNSHERPMTDSHADESSRVLCSC